jgi:hypothetical protein
MRRLSNKRATFCKALFLFKVPQCGLAPFVKSFGHSWGTKVSGERIFGVGLDAMGNSPEVEVWHRSLARGLVDFGAIFQCRGRFGWASSVILAA